MSLPAVLPQFCDKGEIVVSALLAAKAPQPVDMSAFHQSTTEVHTEVLGHGGVHTDSNVCVSVIVHCSVTCALYGESILCVLCVCVCVCVCVYVCMCSDEKVKL